MENLRPTSPCRSCGDELETAGVSAEEEHARIRVNTWVISNFQSVEKKVLRGGGERVCNQRCSREKSAKIGVMEAKKVKRFKTEDIFHGFKCPREFTQDSYTCLSESLLRLLFELYITSESNAELLQNRYPDINQYVFLEPATGCDNFKQFTTSLEKSGTYKYTWSIK